MYKFVRVNEIRMHGLNMYMIFVHKIGKLKNAVLKKIKAMFH